MERQGHLALTVYAARKQDRGMVRSMSQLVLGGSANQPFGKSRKRSFDAGLPLTGLKDGLPVSRRTEQTKH